MASNEILNNDIIICLNAIVISLNYFKQTVLDAHLSLDSVDLFRINPEAA